MKAFPHPNVVEENEKKHYQLTEASSGMDLRDYFAAKVLNASWISSLDDLTRGEVKDIATTCYIIADSMMEARKVKND